jgi:putative addiction module component (TIGR02574 family)
MNVDSRNILDRALKLSDSDRAFFIEQLMASLDKPDEAIDALWEREAEERVAGYRAGKLRSLSLAEVLAKYPT